MTPKGHELFIDYLKNLRASGKLFFTAKQAMIDLDLSRNAIKKAVHRLNKSGDLISPAKGLYIIVPPEYKPQGSIPAEDLVVILAKYLGIDYYSGLLTAAMYYGASHQKPGAFQIITNKRIKHALTFGQIRIDRIYKKSMANLPTKEVAVRAGYLRISSPELTAMDLFLYPNRSGGINHIATVLSELVDAIDPDKLIKLAKDSGKLAWVQRLGYTLEKIEAMNSSIQQQIINALANYIKSKHPRFIPLTPEISTRGYPRSKKWMLIENATIEGD